MALFCCTESLQRHSGDQQLCASDPGQTVSRRATNSSLHSARDLDGARADILHDATRLVVHQVQSGQKGSPTSGRMVRTLSLRLNYKIANSNPTILPTTTTICTDRLHWFCAAVSAVQRDAVGCLVCSLSSNCPAAATSFGMGVLCCLFVAPSPGSTFYVAYSSDGFRAHVWLMERMICAH